MVTSPLAPPGYALDPSGPAIERRRPRRRVRFGPALLTVLVLLAVFAPLLAPYPPDAIDTDHVLQGPSWQHLLGSDDTGRDVLSRLLYAYRVSLSVAAGSIVVALPIGALIGLIAGYFGRAVDTVLMRPVEMLLAVPALLLALSAVSIFGNGVSVTVLAIAVIYVPVFARVVRSSTQVVRTALYVTASRTRGASHVHILFRHVLPNAIGPALVQASVLAGVAIQIEAALSYLGLGVQPPTASLGNMLAQGQQFLSLSPWTCIFPGVALALTALAFNLCGDVLRERLDPRGLAK